MAEQITSNITKDNAGLITKNIEIMNARVHNLTWTHIQELKAIENNKQEDR